MLNNFRLRLWAWLVAVIVIFSAFGYIISNSVALNTSIYALLPKHNLNPSLTEATHKFTSGIGEKAIFLVSAPNKKDAIDATQEFAKELEKSDVFSQVNQGVDDTQQMAWGTFYFPYREQLLSDEKRKELQSGGNHKIVQEALVSLYSPMGIANRKLLDNDPFFLYQNYLMTLPKPSSNLSLQDGYLMTEKDGRWYTLVQTRVYGDVFSSKIQNNFFKIVDKAEDGVSIKNVEILRTGLIFYAHMGAESAHQEVSTIGVGSIVGIILLTLFAFRSLKPLFFILLSIGVGFVTAFVVTYLLLGKVFIFTLVFGASLVGISVDYAYFYYAERMTADKDWTPKIGLNRIFWGITLGLLNVILAFAVIAVAPFPGLHQLAVFAISGLIGSYLTVVCLFPYIMPKLKEKHINKTSLLLKANIAYLALWQKLPIKFIVISIGLLATVGTVGVLQIKANDDIHILESTSPELKAAESQIKSIMGSNIGLDYIIVLGKDSEELLEKADATTVMIREKYPNMNNPLISISDYVPSTKEQKLNHKLINELNNESLDGYLTKIGYSKEQTEKVKQDLSSLEFTPLELKTWLKSPAAEQMKFLWLGKQDVGLEKEAMAIVLSKDISVKGLEEIAEKTEGVYLIDTVGEINEVFSHYRVMLMYMVFIVLGLLFLAMVWRYSFKKALVYMVPPAVACISAMAVFGWFAIPVTLFSVLALILVLGVSMDYVIFLAESGERNKGTMLALCLSAITTILSFGLLALSSMPAISYFGLTVLVGITVAFILAPLVTRG